MALAVEDKIDDDDLYSSVLLVQQVEPPEVVNPIKPKGKVAASPPPSPAMPEIRRGAFLSPPPSPPASAELPDWRREAMAFLENEGDTGGGLSAGEEAEEAPTARVQAIEVPVSCLASLFFGKASCFWCRTAFVGDHPSASGSRDLLTSRCSYLVQGGTQSHHMDKSHLQVSLRVIAILSRPGLLPRKCARAVAASSFVHPASLPPELAAAWPIGR